MAAAFGVEPAHGRRIDEGKKLLLGTCLLPLVLLKVGMWDHDVTIVVGGRWALWGSLARTLTF